MKGRELCAGQIPDAALPRFWASIQTGDGCWIWKGNLDTKGYGKFRTGGQSLRATRAMYALVKGKVPADRVVCHTCDTPACCNPAHLWLGTIADNSRDMVQKGRSSRRIGSANTRCRLTVDQVRAIRGDHRQSAAIARSYGVARTTIRDIRLGRTWSSVA